MANPFSRSNSRGGVTRKDAKAMGNMLAGGKNARGSVYSRTMREPAKERLLSSRALTALVLLIAVPPIGIGFVWRKQMFLPRGRVLLTLVSTLILMVMVLPSMPSGGMATVKPAPTQPESFTHISGISAQADLDRVSQISDQTGGPVAAVVYLLEGDEYYHKEARCGDLSLTYGLTVSQAQERGLEPCPDCQPPA